MSLQSLYLCPYPTLAAKAAWGTGVGTARKAETASVESGGTIERISKTGKQIKNDAEKENLSLKSGEFRSKSGDLLSLSDKTSGTAKNKSQESQKAESEKTEKAGNVKTDQNLTPEEEKQVQELKSRDTEVRAHEAAHLAAAGGHAQGGASFTYQTGPDGKKYAVGGEVSVDTSSVDGNPEATIQKARQIRAAALAPAQPSSQDMNVAARASKMEVQARQELSRQQSEAVTQNRNDEETIENSPKIDTGNKNAGTESKNIGAGSKNLDFSSSDSLKTGISAASFKYRAQSLSENSPPNISRFQVTV